MITRSVLRYARISPRKIRPVIQLVKGKKPDEAIAILFSVKKKASVYLIELIKSAVVNAQRIPGIELSDLRVSRIVADGGPQMKRFRAGSMGRAGQIRKRTSHITVELDSATSVVSEMGKHAQSIQPHKDKTIAKTDKTTRTAAVKKVKTKESVKPTSAKKGKE